MDIHMFVCMYAYRKDYIRGWTAVWQAVTQMVVVCRRWKLLLQGGSGGPAGTVKQGGVCSTVRKAAPCVATGAPCGAALAPL